MDKRSEFEVPDEQRSLMNAGHGPPFQHPTADGRHFWQIGSPHGLPDFETANRAKADELHSKPCAGRAYFDALMPPPFATPAMARAGAFSSNICDYPTASHLLRDKEKLMGAIKEQNEEIHRLSCELRRVSSNSELVAWENQKQINTLKADLASKSNEVEELKRNYEGIKSKYQQLTRALSSLPSHPGGPSFSRSDLSLHLVATEEMQYVDNGQMKNQKNDDENLMMKSVQCSEVSLEQLGKTSEDKEPGQLEDNGLKPVKASGSSSSSSFEIVDNDLSPEKQTVAPVGDEAVQELTEISSQERVTLEKEVEHLKLKVEKLERFQESEKSKQTVEIAQLHEKFSQLSLKIAINPSEKDPAQDMHIATNRTTDQLVNTENMLPDWVSRDLQKMAKSMAELEKANWKLTEQNCELMKERELSMKKMKEEDGRSSFALEEELRKMTRLLAAKEDQLKAGRQRLAEMETVMQEVEEMRRNWQRNTAVELATENALLKHQIEAYKEDFEVERKDRENIVSQKDTLQRCYDTLRVDLDVARKQVKQYEGDIQNLRQDNNTMRTKLRQVSEELSILKDQNRTRVPFESSGTAASNSRLIATSSASSPNCRLIATSAPSEAFSPERPVALPGAGPLTDWECGVCTFKNPALRVFCEMCGTQCTREPVKSSVLQVPPHGATIFSNMSSKESTAVKRSLPPTASASSPHLPNLRNYGDIETD